MAFSNAPIRDPEVRRALRYFAIAGIIGYLFTGTLEGVVGFGFVALIFSMLWTGLARTFTRIRSGSSLTQALDSGLPPGIVQKDGGMRMDVYDVGLKSDNLFRRFRDASPEDIDKAIEDELDGESA